MFPPWMMITCCFILFAFTGNIAGNQRVVAGFASIGKCLLYRIAGSFDALDLHGRADRVIYLAANIALA